MKTNNITPIQLIVNYMLKEIQHIKETRKMLREKHPDLFPNKEYDE